MKRIKTYETETFNESRGAKYKIYVDRNLVKVGEILKGMGYWVYIFPKELEYKEDGDMIIHTELNTARKSMNGKPVIFATNDFDDFEKPRFEVKRYKMFRIHRQETEEKTAKKIAGKISNLGTNELKLPSAIDIY